MTGPDDVSLERIRRVVELIVDLTGLVVDVTAGWSPTRQRVALPAGRYGRPPLLIEEGRAKKGVALVILAAVDCKSVALFVLVLLVTAGFLGNAALASVGTRRTEIGVLLCLGWAPPHIFRAVLGELALVGLLAGVVGSGIAAALVAVLSLQVPLERVIVLPLLSVALAALAGAIPTVLAARGRPVDVVNPATAGPSTIRGTPNLRALAWVAVRRRPGRAAVAAAGLLIGVAALSMLLAINLAFRGSLADSVLGEFIAVQACTVDYVSVALTIGLAAFSVADVLVPNAREHAAELATLQAVGWSDRDVALLTLRHWQPRWRDLRVAVGLVLDGPVAPLLPAGAAGGGRRDTRHHDRSSDTCTTEPRIPITRIPVGRMSDRL